MFPILPTLPEEDRRAAYQRGKILTEVMVIGTAVGLLIPALTGLVTNYAAHDWPDFVFAPILIGLLIWFGLRGEGISTGCLMALYALPLFGIVATVGVVALLYSAPQLFTASDGTHPQLGPLDWHEAPGFWETAAYLGGAAWVGFAFWVLVFSKDVRFYRNTRRRRIHSVDDPAFTSPVPPPLPPRGLPLLPEPVRAAVFPPVDPETYRRGKFLTITVVLGTAILFLMPEMRDVWFGYPPDRVVTHGQNPWADFVFSGVFIGLFSWCAWRGGRNSTGCLTIFYSLGLVFVGFASLLVVAFAPWSAKSKAGINYGGISIKDIGHDFGDTFSFVALGAWIAFACWVLIWSRDARAYRDARQRRAWTTAGSFNEWHLRRH